MPDTSSSDNHTVVHNEAQNRFETKLGDEFGVLLYEMVDDVMDILSVQVPPAYRICRILESRRRDCRCTRHYPQQSAIY